MARSTELLVGFCALAAPAMGWLFYSGFISGRHAGLVWPGAVDVERLGILSGAAIFGVAFSLWMPAARA